MLARDNKEMRGGNQGNYFRRCIENYYIFLNISSDIQLIQTTLVLEVIFSF